MSSDFAIIAQPDWNLRNVLRQHLDGAGFRCLVTPMAAEAEDFAARVLARVVILDVELPGISGYETCVRIRHRPGYETVPILLLTGLDLPRRRAAARRAGADALLIKPFSMNDLMREIESRLPGGCRTAGSRPERAEPIAGFAEAPVQVWEPPPSLEWRFGEGSDLSHGKRLLEMLRPRIRR
jgi:DNA-binding response OmpR family regulator